MITEEKEMKQALIAIARARALKHCKQGTIFCFCILFVIEVVYRYAVTALLLALIYTVLPSYFGALVMKKEKRGTVKEVFPYIKKSLGFKKEQYLGDGIVTILIISLILIWQYACIQSSIEQVWIRYGPSAILLYMIGCYGSYLMYYRIKIPYLVKNNLL